jgi:uncharacterized membrane protein YfcA
VDPIATTWIVIIAAGGLAGFLAGLLGIGGGLVVVPTLAFAFASRGMSAEIALPVAFGTSMASVLFTSISSVRAHRARGTILWQPVKWIAPGVVAGALVGALASSVMPVAAVRAALTVYVTIIATQMLLGLTPPVMARPLGRPALTCVGAAIGATSASVGFGGAVLTVPLLTWCGAALPRAIGTSAAIGFPIAAAGTLGYVLSGALRADLPPFCLGFVNLPALLGIVMPSMLMAPLGARLTGRLPVGLLRRMFAIVLYTTAFRLAA